MHSRQTGFYFLVALLAAACVVAYFIFRPFLAPLILAAVFAVVLRPAYERVLRRMPRWPSLASLLTVAAAMVCILIPLSVIVTEVGIEARNLYGTLSEPQTRLHMRDVVRDFDAAVSGRVPSAAGFSERLAGEIPAYAQSALKWVIQNLGTAFSSALALFLKFFLFFFALYYLLRDGARLKQRLVQLSPLRDDYDESVFKTLEAAVNSVIKGNLTIALIQGTLTAIGFTVFGVPNSVLWGTVTAVAALIPGLGTSIVFIPTILYMYFIGETGSALGLVVWGILAVGLIDNFLSPQLIGQGAKLHPLLVLLAVLGGIAFFGPVGVFLGPLAVSLLFALLDIYARIEHAARREAHRT